MKKSATVAEVELVYKSKVKAADRPYVRSTVDAYTLLFNFWNKNKLELQEQFVIMLLNRNNQVLGICEISSGSTSRSIVDSKLVFSTALKAHASAIIVAHYAKHIVMQNFYLKSPTVLVSSVIRFT